LHTVSEWYCSGILERVDRVPNQINSVLEGFSWRRWDA